MRRLISVDRANVARIALDLLEESEQSGKDDTGTAVEPYEDLLPEIDMLLLMTVEPGFGGQHFLDIVLPKLRRARSLVAEHGAAIWLQVDGGVHEETIEQCAEAGADVFVAGSAVFGSEDPAAAVRALRAQAERATAHAAWHRSGLMSLDF